MKSFLVNLQLPVVYIVRNIYGDNYTTAHRQRVGIVFALVGIGITHIDFFPAVHFVFEYLGATVHAMGITPFLDGASKFGNQNDAKNDNSNE